MDGMGVLHDAWFHHLQPQSSVEYTVQRFALQFLFNELTAPK